MIEFDEEEPALRFEQYLKTGWWREFARRHFRQTVRRSGSTRVMVVRAVRPASCWWWSAKRAAGQATQRKVGMIPLSWARDHDAAVEHGLGAAYGIRRRTSPNGQSVETQPSEATES